MRKQRIKYYYISKTDFDNGAKQRLDWCLYSCDSTLKKAYEHESCYGRKDISGEIYYFKTKLRTDIYDVYQATDTKFKLLARKVTPDVYDDFGLPMIRTRTQWDAL